MRKIIVIIILLQLIIISGSMIKDPNKIKDVMRPIVTKQDVAKLMELVSPIYGLDVNRVEFGVSSDIEFRAKYNYRYLAKGDPFEGKVGYIGEILLVTKDCKIISNKLLSKVLTGDYNIEELAVIEQISGVLFGYSDKETIARPVLEKYPKNMEFFLKLTKPQLLKQKQIVSGVAFVTLDSKEEYYEFGYYPLKAGGAETFHFHTDKNGNLWLWAIQ